VYAAVTDALGGPKNAAKALLFVLGTLVTFKLGVGLVSAFKDVKKAVNETRKAATLLHAKLFANTAEDASAGLVSKAKTALTSIGTALASTARSVVAAGRKVAARLIAVFATEGALAGAAAGNAAAGAEGLAKPGIKTRVASVGRGLGKAFGLALTAGAILGLAGLAAEVTKKVKDALKVHPGGRGSLLDNLLPERLLPDFKHLDGPLGKALTKLFGKHAAGGIIPGSGDRDTYAALLTPGEAVTRKAIVQHFGPTVFADINAGRLDPRVGYQAGQRPMSGGVRVSGPRFASGGLVGAGVAVADRPNLTVHNNITVPGGGPPDPVALGVQSSRVIESRFGGDVRQD
jgi:hypothetical protein